MPCLPRLAHEAPVMKAAQFCHLLLQGTVQRRRGQQQKRWENNISEWTGSRFCNALREAENKIKWRERVALSVAPQRSPWLHNYKVQVLTYFTSGPSPARRTSASEVISIIVARSIVLAGWWSTKINCCKKNSHLLSNKNTITSASTGKQSWQLDSDITL